tara:strand:- start:49 stop:345 length:297 start_codon:yes stop_codon:yes gene_type:complete
MQSNTMDIENIPYADFSLNYQDEDDEENYEDNDQENPNDTLEEAFHYEVEQAIDTGNITFIKNAINDYGHLIDKSYIEWANSIVFQIVEEKMEDIMLN